VDWIRRQRRADERASVDALADLLGRVSRFRACRKFSRPALCALVAEKFGCEHSEVMVSAEECQAHLPKLVVQQDEPIGDPACLPMHFVCKAAHDAGIKVVLVGRAAMRCSAVTTTW